MPMRLLATSKRRRAQETQTLLPEGRAEREVTGARPGLNTSHGKLWRPWGAAQGRRARPGNARELRPWI